MKDEIIKLLDKIELNGYEPNTNEIVKANIIIQEIYTKLEAWSCRNCLNYSYNKSDKFEWCGFHQNMIDKTDCCNHWEVKE